MPCSGTSCWLTCEATTEMSTDPTLVASISAFWSPSTPAGNSSTFSLPVLSTTALNDSIAGK